MSCQGVNPYVARCRLTDHGTLHMRHGLSAWSYFAPLKGVVFTNLKSVLLPLGCLFFGYEEAGGGFSGYWTIGGQRIAGIRGAEAHGLGYGPTNCFTIGPSSSTFWI